MAKTNYLYPVIAIAASIAGFAIAKAWIVDHDPRGRGVTVPPSNFVAFDNAFDLSHYLERSQELAADGQAGRGVLFLSGMSKEAAMHEAAAAPDLDVSWAPGPITDEASGVDALLGSDLLPWVLFYGIPARGPNAGAGVGEPMPGTLQQHMAHLDAAIDYARNDGPMPEAIGA